MLPSRVIYQGNIFDTIGLIKLNNGSFLIIKNNEKTVSLDLSKAQGLSLNLKFAVKEATKVETVLIDFIMQVLKNNIKNNKYKDKKELMDEVALVNRYINTHNELLNNMKELDFKDDLVDKTLLQLLNYFDEVMQPTLNLDDITSFEIGNKDYIKFKDENGKVRILDDSYDHRNTAEQFQSKQNESMAFQSNDGRMNALEIANDTLKFTKPEVVLESTVLDNNLDNTLINSQPTLKNDDIVGNSSEKIFYDQNDDKVLTMNQNIEEVTQPENNSPIIYPPYDEVTVTLLLFKGQDNLDVNQFLNQYLNDLTVEQIDFLINNYVLTTEQITSLNNQKKAKQITNSQVEKPKTMILKKTDKAAFIDSLLLSFIVGLVWGIYLTFLIIIILS